MAHENIVIRGAREHNLKDVTVTPAARSAGRDHRPVRVGQVEPGLRHALRRGPAALCRVALGVRAPVPRPDGQARRRLDRGALAGDLDRPEDHRPQPAVDRRHGHRDLRLPAPAVRPGRPPALPQVRPRDHRPDGRADRRAGAGAARGDAVHGRRAGRAHAQGRVPRAVRAAARRRLHARQGRRAAAAARGADRPRQAGAALDLGGGRPAGDEARAAHAPDRLGRDGPAAGRGAGRGRRSSTARR